MLLFGTISTLVLLAAVAFVLKWLTSQLSARRNADSLTPQDLKVLEDAAGRMIDEIKETAAVAVRDLDDRCEELRKLLLIADQRIALWSQIASEAGKPVSPPASAEDDDSVEANIYRLADAGASSAEIAQQTGLPVGEVSLMLGLRSTARV